MKRKKQNKFLSLALRKIDANEYNSSLLHRHVAVVVKGGRVLSIGRNRYKTHPKSSEDAFCRSVHAEMDAIWKIKDKSLLQGATIYVARKGRNDLPGMSCPCMKCQEIISKHGMRRAVFTTEHGTGTMDF